MIYDCLCLPSCLPEPEYILHPLPPLLPVYTILYRVPLPASSRSINQFITQPASDPPPIEMIVSPLLLSCHQARRKSKHICSQQQVSNFFFYSRHALFYSRRHTTAKARHCFISPPPPQSSSTSVWSSSSSSSSSEFSRSADLVGHCEMSRTSLLQWNAFGFFNLANRRVYHYCIFVTSSRKYSFIPTHLSVVRKPN